ncbi:MAG: DUF5317 domain-containing protein [Microthrixaceae bacterium]|nr:DUF5317 family protein [Microthrixaceae bacterium]MCO5313532.1 DUF5317 domain-containing protein [Microthrixaceae bacterium]
MAIIPTIVALALGVGLGLWLGGSVERARSIRPDLARTAAVALAVQILAQVIGLSGGWAVFVDLVSKGALIAFAVFNLRIGGMVVLAAGLSLNWLVTILNWGMPTSRAALERAGLIDPGTTGTVHLTGARHVADGDRLSFLGEVIALPTHQVISIGDVLTLVGVVLVIMAVLRARVLPAESSPLRLDQITLPRGPRGLSRRHA